MERNRKFWIKAAFILLTLVLIIGTAQVFRMFYIGYHNVDLAYNFAKIGFTSDLASDFKYYSLDELYIRGTNSMKKAIDLSILIICGAVLWTIFFMTKFKKINQEVKK